MAFASSIVEIFSCLTYGKPRSAQLVRCGWGRRHCVDGCSQSPCWLCSPSGSWQSWSPPALRWPCWAAPGLSATLATQWSTRQREGGQPASPSERDRGTFLLSSATSVPTQSPVDMIADHILLFTQIYINVWINLNKTNLIVCTTSILTLLNESLTWLEEEICWQTSCSGLILDCASPESSSPSFISSGTVFGRLGSKVGRQERQEGVFTKCFTCRPHKWWHVRSENFVVSSAVHVPAEQEKDANKINGRPMSKLSPCSSAVQPFYHFPFQCRPHTLHKSCIKNSWQKWIHWCHWFPEETKN